MKFKDRVSTTLNNKILKVKNVERDETGEISSMEVEVIRNDKEGLKEEGTELNANSLTKIIQEMINNDINSLALTEEEKLASDVTTLEIETQVSDRLELPVEGHRKCPITWEVLTGSGITIKDNQATITQELVAQEATIKATITNGNISGTKEFDIKISKRAMTIEEAITEDLELINIPVDVIEDFTLPQTGKNGSNITWESISLNGDYIENNRKVVVERENWSKMINLKATLTKGEKQMIKLFDVRIIGKQSFNPNLYETTFIQTKTQPKQTFVTITKDSTSLNEEDEIYVEIENTNEDIDVSIVDNNTVCPRVRILETNELNTREGSGVETFTFSIKVYLKGNYELLLGNIQCTVDYYYTSTTPED